MADPKSLAAVVEKQKAEKLATELAEDTAAKAKDVPEGMEIVRLLRPFYFSGKLLPAGIHTLPIGKAPASAKKL